MKVKDIIKDNAIWISSPAYEDLQPEISVFMPTYSRGGSGFFLRSVNSILSQTFKNFELIIIDDASVDGTADQIDQLITSEPRIACIKHKKNIGLPAISEYEAYMKSRGQYVIFAFDDFSFRNDAFENLLNEIKVKKGFALAGVGVLNFADGKKLELGRSKTQLNLLSQCNTFVNASFIIKRDVFENVGLYDPHVILSRLCDWDLWLRITQHYELILSNIYVGEEFGCTLNDSLGNSYPLSWSLSTAYMLKDRSKKLLPQLFEDFDILEGVFFNGIIEENIYQSFLNKFKNKFWFENKFLDKQSELYPYKKKVVLVDMDFTASVSLYFESVLCSKEYYIERVEFHNDFLIYQILNASCLILSRVLSAFIHTDAYKIAKALQIPIYYFVDDNYLAIERTCKDHDKFYTEKNVKSVLEGWNGILVTSEPLKIFYEQMGFAGKVRKLSLITNNVLLESAPAVLQRKASIQVGIFGNLLRITDFKEKVLETLLASNLDFHFFIRSGVLENSPHITNIKLDLEFNQFILKWKSLEIDIILHPRCNTENTRYKTENVILCAAYIGAIPIVYDEPSYSHLDISMGVIKLETDDPHALLDAIKKLDDMEYRKELKSRLRDYVSRSYLPGANEKEITAVVRECPFVEPNVYDNRVYSAIGQLATKAAPMRFSQIYVRLIKMTRDHGLIYVFRKIFTKLKERA